MLEERKKQQPLIGYIEQNIQNYIKKREKKSLVLIRAGFQLLETSLYEHKPLTLLYWTRSAIMTKSDDRALKTNLVVTYIYSRGQA